MSCIEKAALLAAVCLLAGPAAAQSDAEARGELNPEELTWERVIRDVERGETSMTACASGYFITKSGRHGPARLLFERCAEDGWTGAMTWMSQLDENGLGGPQDSGRAAEWDRRAAEAGDPVGKFNRGLDLLRGHGVAPDPQAGRRLIDEAARDGLGVAADLRAAGYDPRAVTPDADEWRYQPMY